MCIQLHQCEKCAKLIPTTEEFCNFHKPLPLPVPELSAAKRQQLLELFDRIEK